MEFLLEARLQVFTLCLPLYGMNSLFRGPPLVREGVSVHGMHFMDNFRTSFPEVVDGYIPLLLQVLQTVWQIIVSR